MLKSIKHFFDWLLDNVCWIVIYPVSTEHPNGRSIRLSWTIAKDYAEMFKGKIVHIDDVEA
jgi:hypothetical protein